MASNFISVLFNVLACFCGWISFAISIAAVVVADWTRIERTDARIGLFEICTITTDECQPIPGNVFLCGMKDRKEKYCNDVMNYVTAHFFDAFNVYC